MVVHSLAQTAGVLVAEARLERFGSDHHTFLTSQFNHTNQGQRTHMASAMTMTQRQDGDDASAGASYLELADFLVQHGAHPNEDLAQLWRRIVFSMCVRNADDHLRNHAFLLVPGHGWRLSPAYDLNPAPLAEGLRLNVSERDNAIDLELAREVAPYFRVGADEAQAICDEVLGVVRGWRAVGEGFGASRQELDRVAPAFRLAEGR